MDSADDGRNLWEYSNDGEPPNCIATIPHDVDVGKTATKGRWRGVAGCENDRACEPWLCDIDPHGLEKNAPFLCPTCRVYAGWPKLVWRTARISCGTCGCVCKFSVMDPSDEWPEEIECPHCDSTITIPLVGRALIH